MTNFSVRYIVDDVDAAVDFYTAHLQFEVAMRPGPGFAMLRRGDSSAAAEFTGRRRRGRPGRGRDLGQNPAAGTDFSWRSTTSICTSTNCGRTASIFAAT